MPGEGGAGGFAVTHWDVGCQPARGYLEANFVHVATSTERVSMPQCNLYFIGIRLAAANVVRVVA